jgi:isoleucyl-tRNA synthetase
MAPILSFTCEEAWAFLPDHAGKAASIHLERFPEVDEELRHGVDSGRWERIMTLRDRLLKEIEAARAQKRIGDSLEAAVEVVASGDDEKFLRENSELFRTILVIAGLDVRGGEEETITVRKAGGRKCPRCWNWVTPDPVHPELCPRCAAVAAATAKE